MRTSTHNLGTLARFVGLFVVAASLNYPWELAQAQLFVQSPVWGASWWHCLVASLGDGVVVWLIYIIGWAVFRRSDWFESPHPSQYALMLATGALIAIVVEWVAVHLAHRWAYMANMPVLPGLNIGLVPILQMLVLPPVIFRLVAVWANRHKR
jgi:zinc transporter ZupT